MAAAFLSFQLVVEEDFNKVLNDWQIKTKTKIICSLTLLYVITDLTRDSIEQRRALVNYHAIIALL